MGTPFVSLCLMGLLIGSMSWGSPFTCFCIAILFVLSVFPFNQTTKPPAKVAKLEPLAFEGKILERPEEPHKVANLQFRLTYYLERIRELEKELHLLPGEVPELNSERRMDLLDLHYRAGILRRVVKDGKVDTGEVYGFVRTRRSFSHEQYINSASHVEIDLATSGIPPKE